MFVSPPIASRTIETHDTSLRTLFFFILFTEDVSTTVSFHSISLHTFVQKPLVGPRGVCPARAA